jgi:WD40 repeat protein
VLWFGHSAHVQGNLLVSGSLDHTIRIWDLKKWAQFFAAER